MSGIVSANTVQPDTIAARRGRPILFSALMVRALLDGRKTMTRRLLKPQPYDFIVEDRKYWNSSGAVGGRICVGDRALLDLHRKPRAGDRLYVREHWRTESDCYDDLAPTQMGGEETILYAADADWALNKTVGRHRQGMHMPRWASRLTLIVTDVRVERLQDISEADAIAEGVERDSDGWRDYLMPHTQCCASATGSFGTLWDSINGPGVWGANPWVSVTSFDVHRRNIDQMDGLLSQGVGA